MSKKLTVIPNRGGRLGHQFFEWLNLYMFCKKNDITFYHHKFLSNSLNQDEIFNLSYDEKKFEDYSGETIMIQEMSLNEYLSSDIEDLYVYDFYYPNDRVKFDWKNDEYRDVLREKYFSDKKESITDTICVHIRRDRMSKLRNKELNKKRYIDIQYFINILNELYETYPSYEVKVFSSNVDDSFFEIKKTLYDLSFHIDEDINDSLNTMINSKILVTSNSGFSFIPSIISNKKNIKICPSNFWLKWPNESIIKNNIDYV